MKMIFRFLALPVLFVFLLMFYGYKEYYMRDMSKGSSYRLDVASYYKNAQQDFPKGKFSNILLESSGSNPIAAAAVINLYEVKGDYKGRDEFLINLLVSYPDSQKELLFKEISWSPDPESEVSVDQDGKIYEVSRFATMNYGDKKVALSCINYLEQRYDDLYGIYRFFDFYNHTRAKVCEFINQ